MLILKFNSYEAWESIMVLGPLGDRLGVRARSEGFGIEAFISGKSSLVRVSFL